ncbi:Conserved_hypothetical protein [Hexamita inflata]|uniref:Uncharacterized protein n=1 Tax=Hexamita inflata TaxID=28002 RepID=A0AA86UBX0_9EUKA|nr:Conserved hypothetical protein [Hexamita inflata]
MKHNQQFKAAFEATFIKVVYSKTQIVCKNVFNAHSEYLQRKDVKFSIWKEMSKYLKTSSKKVHDFYHNTWSKQFYDDIAPYRQQIKYEVLKTSSYDTIQELVNVVHNKLTLRYPSVNLHYQTLYQLVYYINNNRRLFVQSKYENELECFAFSTLEQFDQMGEF